MAVMGSIRVTGVIILLVVMVYRSHGQNPFDMTGMMLNMNNMMADLQNMGQNMFSEGIRNAQWSRHLGPGQRTFTTHDGGRGFAFSSPDGTFSSFSFTSGGPGSSGFMFYQGPDGRWERRW